VRKETVAVKCGTVGAHQPLVVGTVWFDVGLACSAVGQRSTVGI